MVGGAESIAIGNNRPPAPNKKEKAGNLSKNSDICRNGNVSYTTMGGRRMDKPKLNFRFHCANSTEALTRQLLRVCIDANMNRIEQIMREEAALVLDGQDEETKNSYQSTEEDT